MCGLVGMAGDLQYRDELSMKRLLVLDYFRGTDSTGLAAVRESGEFKVAKISSNPIDLFDSGKFKDALNGTLSKVFIGHNRAATRGGVNSANAHPFEVDHIVGAHNGTLDYQSWKRIEEELGEQFTVDSLALFHGIAKLGVEKTIELCETGRTYTDGAWSLVWYDRIADTINFLRNKHRPMWWAFTKDFKYIFWASEWPMLDAMFKMAGSAYEQYSEGKEGFKYWGTDEDQWLSFKLSDLKSGGDKRPKPKAKTVKGREPKSVATSGDVDPFDRELAKTTTTVGFEKTTTQSHSSTTKFRSSTKGNKTKDKPVTVIHLLGDSNRPLAGWLDKERYEQMAKFGCSFCSDPVPFGTDGITIFERTHEVLCRRCSGNDKVPDSLLPPTRIYTMGSAMDSLMGQK